MSPTIRRATPADLPAMFDLDERAFGFSYGEQGREDGVPTMDLDRFLLAEDDGELVGITGAYGFEVTPPGAKPIATEGVTWVATSVTHRRRGVLRGLFIEQHRGYVAAGVPLSVLTASESGIYGRFGYGAATVDRRVEITRRRAVVRADAPDPGGVRYATGERFAELAPDLHARWCAVHPGAVSRSAAYWRRHLLDRDYARGGASGLFHLVHPDGFVSYRVADDTARVVDHFAVTDAAHAALWRTLLSLDLVETVTARTAPDDPLPHLLTDPRQVRTVEAADGMWARLVDVPAALAARRYAVEVDAVLEVRDPFLGRGGRFRLAAGPDGADCAPTDRAADAHLDVDVLGALYFGGSRLRGYVAAGRAAVADGRLLRRLDIAFTADRDPRYGTGF